MVDFALKTGSLIIFDSKPLLMELSSIYEIEGAKAARLKFAAFQNRQLYRADAWSVFERAFMSLGLKAFDMWAAARPQI